MRRVRAGIFPGGVLLAGALVARAWAPPGLLDELGRGYPWVACAAAFLLGALFHRSRAAVAGVATALGAWGLSAGWDGALVGAALALTFGLLAPMADRGVAAVGTLAQWAAAVVPLALAAMVAGGGAPEVAALFGLSGSPERPDAAAGLPPAQVFVYGAALLPLGFALLRRRGPIERGLSWGLAAVALGVHPSVEPQAAPVFFLAAGLTLALSVVEASYRMAYRDELTGLPGRRALMRDLDALGGTYALAMVDVDHFKKFNDRHGHDVGDQVLRLVASRLARAPGGARAYRYGGEEFTLLMPGLRRDDAMRHLEEVRRAVEESSFVLRSWKRPLRKRKGARGGKRKKTDVEPRRLSVTVSIGVGDSNGAAGGHPDVLKKADRALYRAKRAGRNRVAR